MAQEYRYQGQTYKVKSGYRIYSTWSTTDEEPHKIFTSEGELIGEVYTSLQAVIGAGYLEGGGATLWYTMSHDEMVAAFSEWDRQWREDPDAFESEVKRLLNGVSTDEYGDGATATFIGMLSEVRSTAVKTGKKHS